MPIVRIVYQGKADNHGVLQKLHDGLQEIVASELSTPGVKLDKDSVELIFEKGHTLNRGKDLKILIDGNDFPERTKNVQNRSDNIAERVEKILLPSYGDGKPSFVYVTLSAGGLGKFRF